MLLKSKYELFIESRSFINRIGSLLGYLVWFFFPFQFNYFSLVPICLFITLYYLKWLGWFVTTFMIYFNFFQLSFKFDNSLAVMIIKKYKYVLCNGYLWFDIKLQIVQHVLIFLISQDVYPYKSKLIWFFYNDPNIVYLKNKQIFLISQEITASRLAYCLNDIWTTYC